LWIVAPDLRGYGKTDTPQDVGAYAVQFLADDVLRLMDALGIEQAVVVGHPQAIATSVLSQKLRFWYMLLFKTPVVAEALLKSGNWAAIRQLSRSREQQAIWIDALAPQGRLTAALTYYPANFKASSPRRWNPDDIPVMGVWSEHDPALGEQQMLDSREHCRAGFRYERIEGAGHWMQLTGTDRLNALLLDFMKSPTA
jgi:pimeloyl-ACP methyl ester carboxylesterase